MPRTHSTPPATFLPLATALRACRREGELGPRALLRDLLAGCIVGVVALPLSMALAVATGVAPEQGLATAVVAGAVVAVLGGSRVQVSGPTAAFVVVLAPIVARHGTAGLLLASTMAGVVLLAMGAARLGRLVEFVPYPVTVGFTAGIALVIAVLQLENLLHLEPAPLPAEAGTPERAYALLRALPTARATDAVVGGLALLLLGLWPRFRSRVPAALVALPTAAVVAVLLERFLPGAEVETLRDRFGTPAAPDGIPRGLPAFVLPWTHGGASGTLDLALVRELLPSAVAIALLGSIESLLSATVADGMLGTQHDPDGELVALGIGNLVAPFFGGFAATGAIARTATNIRSGGRTPLAALFHALFVLAAMLALAPLLGWLPMSALAALLVIVAWNMAEARHLVRVLRTAPKSDALVLLACLVTTAVIDMTVGVLLGIVLASLLFMRRMTEISGARLVSELAPPLADLPPGVQIYEIAGPLYFGAAHKATSIFRRVAPDVRTVVLDLAPVPVVDATGLFNLGSSVDRLRSRGVNVVLAGLRPQPERTLRRAGLLGPGGVPCHASAADAVAALRAASATGEAPSASAATPAALPAPPPTPAPPTSDPLAPKALPDPGASDARGVHSGRS